MVRKYMMARRKNGDGDSIDYGVGLVVYQVRVRFEGPNSVKLGESTKIGLAYAQAIERGE